MSLAIEPVECKGDMVDERCQCVACYTITHYGWGALASLEDAGIIGKVYAKPEPDPDDDVYSYRLLVTEAELRAALALFFASQEPEE
jgi:hypothetical protein